MPQKESDTWKVSPLRGGIILMPQKESGTWKVPPLQTPQGLFYASGGRKVTRRLSHSRTGLTSLSLADTRRFLCGFFVSVIFLRASRSMRAAVCGRLRTRQPNDW